MDYFYNQEVSHDIFSGADYSIQFDIVDNCIDWILCNSEVKCIQFFKSLKLNKGIFIGEFTKAILKINNICKEILKICEISNQINLAAKLEEIPEKILKFICTSQSLYI